MQAVVFKQPGLVKVESVPEPELQAPTDAIVRVTLSAICGSDLHVYHGRFRGFPEGAILGHEFLGIVESVGPEVRTLTPGMRVVGSFFASCGQCSECRAGRAPQCPAMIPIGFGRVAGSQAEWVRVPLADGTLFPIPETLTDERALMAGDILSTAFFTAARGEIRPGDIVAVVGAGPVGLLAIQCAALYGPAAMLALDRIQDRLDLARTFGAVAVRSDESAVDAVREYTGGHGADVVIEAVGSRESLSLALRLARGFGTVAAAGVFLESDVPLNLGRMFAYDLTLRAGMGNIPAVIPRVFGLLEAGKLHPEALVSHQMPLGEAEEAYRRFERREALKILLRP